MAKTDDVCKPVWAESPNQVRYVFRRRVCSQLSLGSTQIFHGRRRQTEKFDINAPNRTGKQ